MRAILTAAAAVVLLLAGCTPTPASTTEVTSLTFHQYQAIEDYDDAEYVQDDPAEIERFVALLDEYDVVPGETVTAAQDYCDGGLSTTVEVGYEDGASAEMFIAACGEPQYDEFNSKATELFSEWHQNLAP